MGTLSGRVVAVLFGAGLCYAGLCYAGLCYAGLARRRVEAQGTLDLVADASSF
jgi:hypothetical protein